MSRPRETQRSTPPEVSPEVPPELSVAVLFARLMLALLFLMLGWYKVFRMGPVEHARRFFVEGYAESWIPAWLLWGVGTAVPVVELTAGLLLVVGYRVRAVLAALALLLLTVTYGHLLADPFFDVTTHILPRAALLLLLLILPRRADRWSLDHLLEARAPE